MCIRLHILLVIHWSSDGLVRRYESVCTEYGWRAGGALSMAFCGWMLLILMLRGPHCGNKTWFGYEGGWEARKDVTEQVQERREDDKQDVEMGTDSRSRETDEKESEERR